jgi:hypothetical protein
MLGVNTKIESVRNKNKCFIFCDIEFGNGIRYKGRIILRKGGVKNPIKKEKEC